VNDGNRLSAIERCPVCGCSVVDIYGYGWDYDRVVCSRSGCPWELELEITCSNYYEEEGEDE